MRHGFLLMDKGKGPTSHDIVSMVRKTLGERKIGHLGTLDPLASGLLVLAVGTKALKVVELFTDLKKEYEADIVFGSVSATFDREGPLEEFKRNPGVETPDEITVRNCIEDRFLGSVEQTPPQASAVKIGGERAYRKMRQGRSVDMPTRSIVIDACDILSYTYPDLRLRIECSSGTYIRSLAHELGQVLRIGGYLGGLRRTKVGEWSIDDAISPDNVTWGHVIPLKDILLDRPKVDLSDDEYDAITHGRTIDHACSLDTIAWHSDLPVALLEEAQGGGIKARKVL